MHAFGFITRGSSVLHPNQFLVNEAWIVFKLNGVPIHTEADGDFDFIALMDAASCFILSPAPVPISQLEPTEMEARRLLKQGKAQRRQLPKTVFIPTVQPAGLLALEAERQGIIVLRVPEDQLLIFIGEARVGFREGFGADGPQ
jgi:hypothetical protein